LVVLGHTLEITFFRPILEYENQFWLWKTIYSFHMPLFFFVSGALHKERPLAEVFKTSLALIFLALFVHCVGWVFNTIRLGIQVRPLISSFIFMRNFQIGVMWYLIAHAFIIFLYQLIKLASVRNRTIVLAAVFFVFLWCQLNGRKRSVKTALTINRSFD
jgi:fucose 4-O-acetylase-like acetyltransferase